MSTRNPYSYPFWGINLTNIPQSTTEQQISNDFKKYGDIFSIKEVTKSSFNIVFKSPKKSTSIATITSEQKKYKITALETSQLPSKKAPATKVSLLKTTAKPWNPKKISKTILSFSSPPPRNIVHTTTTTTTTTTKPSDEGVPFFEAFCKSISHGTSEDELLEFIELNIFKSIREYISKDGIMMLHGQSIAIFELNNKKQIGQLTKIIENMNKDLKFNGNRFSLKRKTNSDDQNNNTPNKTLSIKLDDDENCDNDRIINSNGVNIINDKNGVDYLMGFGFENGIKINNKDEKKTNSNSKGEKKNFYFKLPKDAKEYLNKQAQSLEIPKTALVLMLGVLTTNGPIPIAHYRGWKQNNPNIVGILNPKKQSSKSNNKVDIVPNLGNLTDSSDKNSDALSSNKSPANVGEISLANGWKQTKSFNSQCSPVGSIGSTPQASSATTTLFNGQPNINNNIKNKSSPINKPFKKQIVSNTNTSTLTKAPLVNKNIFNNKLNNNPASAPPTTKRMFQYPNNSALGTSQLFQTNSANLLNMNKSNNLTLISPRGVSLIRMKPNGPSTLLSPTAAAAAAVLLSPRNGRPMNNSHMNNSLIGSNIGPPHVVVPNANDFSPIKPILTPVHIPYLQQQQNNINNGHSPINSGFQSPINYNINTPQSPLANYSGITPIINAFTPTATGVNAITPTTNLPFYWSNIHKNSNQNNNNQMGSINMENDPLAPHNMPPFLPQQNNNQQNNMNSQAPPYVQKQLQNSSLLNPVSMINNINNATSPKNAPSTTFFKYPIPNEEPKSSPSNSNNIMNGQNNILLNNINNNLMQQASINSFHSNNGHNNNDNNNNMSNNDNGMEERQMDEPPSLDEINNMRNIPSVISPNGTTPVVMITNLNEDEIDCDKIFTLCGVFGDVQRVKISYHKRDTAFVQLSNHRQAKHVVTSLNRMQLYGKMIHVNLSRMTRVKLPKDSPNSAMMFPDAKFLTKDYTNCKKHRYSKKGAGGIKYSPLSIGQPSHILHIANLPIQSEAKDLQEFLCGNGIFNNGNNSNNKIQSIELIGVNNKLGSCQAFAKCHSVDIACQILIDFHSKEFLGREIKISFATRSHMPSDINKTHKTYSYTTNKKMGASINSIPSSMVQNNSSNNVPPMNNNASDNMSSSSSSNGHSHSNGHNNNNNNNNGYNRSNNGYSNNGYNKPNNGYNNSYNGYNKMDNGRNFNNQQRNSYMNSYDNNNNVSSYQTYNVINKPQPPPDQDKIFVRQHHHSGGRKYHYKLRINK